MENTELGVCLINDSFPPLIDGVANAVTNYARIITANHGQATVVTPANPQADDSRFPFPVIRYPSIDMTKQFGYPAGVPFSAKTLREVEQRNIDIIHSHCPITSTMLARILRDQLDVPVVFTYHTKFDVDISNAIRGKLLQEEATKILVQNISACDEVWTVSRGAGENLRQLGYEGAYTVMPNGVDLPRGRVEDALIREATEGVDLPENVPVFLFVGRMMWYKGIRIILDGLKMLMESGQDFRMVFIGGGTDKEEITAYAESLKLGGRVIFKEPIRDRQLIRAWYCRADLFLFPSTFDTNGLVVREAAACGLASVLIAGSCAAEDVADGVSGFLIEESADAMAAKLQQLCGNRARMAQVGENAQRDIYMSWEDAVRGAYDRYFAVIDNYRRGLYPRHERFSDRIYQRMAEGLGDYNRAKAARQQTLQEFRDRQQQLMAEIAAERESMKQELELYRTEMVSDLEARRSRIREKIEELSEHMDRFL